MSREFKHFSHNMKMAKDTHEEMPIFQKTILEEQDKNPDDELDNVTKELEDLKVLVGNYENRATKLQTELRLAHDEFCNLVSTRDYSVAQLAVVPETPDLSRIESELDKVQDVTYVPIADLQTEIRRLQQGEQKHKHLIEKLQSRLHQYKERVAMIMQQLVAVKQNDLVTTERGTTADLRTPHRSVATQTLQYQKADKSADGSPDGFTMGLLDVVFQLHQQLVNSHAQRQNEILQHEARTVKLTETFKESLEKLRCRQTKALVVIAERANRQSAAELQELRSERRCLKKKLTDMENEKRDLLQQMHLLELRVAGLEQQLRMASCEHDRQFLPSKRGNELQSIDSFLLA